MFTTDTLKDCHILVTGGGSGLGLAMSKKFLELGASVSICGRTKEKLEAAKARLGKLGERLDYYACDVRQYEEVGEMLNRIFDAHPHFNRLLNNAAGNFYSASEDLTPNGFKTVVDIVLHGTFNTTQQFAKRLIEEGRSAAILNIVTTYTQTGSAFVLPSACAKAGVYTMTKTLAYEWASYGMRLNAIAPGPFPTKGAWDRLIPNADLERQYREILPTKRFGEKEELANLAAFLMSDLCPYITGECVTIDGAESLRGGSFNFLADMFPREELKRTFNLMKSKR